MSMLYQGEALNHQDPFIKWTGRIFAGGVTFALGVMFWYSLFGG